MPQRVERGDPSLLLSTGESSGPRGPVMGSQLQKGRGHTGESETKSHGGATWMRGFATPGEVESSQPENWKGRGDLIKVCKYQIRECKTK